VQLVSLVQLTALKKPDPPGTETSVGVDHEPFTSLIENGSSDTVRSSPTAVQCVESKQLTPSKIPDVTGAPT
jgi:hypothetical protein